VQDGGGASGGQHLRGSEPQGAAVRPCAQGARSRVSKLIPTSRTASCTLHPGCALLPALEPVWQQWNYKPPAPCSAPAAICCTVYAMQLGSTRSGSVDICCTLQTLCTMHQHCACMTSATASAVSLWTFQTVTCLLLLTTPVRVGVVVLDYRCCMQARGCGGHAGLEHHQVRTRGRHV
jgi:hypothetical protein